MYIYIHIWSYVLRYSFFFPPKVMFVYMPFSFYVSIQIGDVCVCVYTWMQSQVYMYSCACSLSSNPIDPYSVMNDLRVMAECRYDSLAVDPFVFVFFDFIFVSQSFFPLPIQVY
jgi:hypothetical protein